MRAAFRLLDTLTEPTIVDYDVEAPDEAGPEQWACPLNLAVEEDDSFTGRLLAEVGRLEPWAMETRSQRGRTLFGVTGAETDQVRSVAAALGHIADTGDVETIGGDGTDQVEWAFDMPLLIRHLAEDLKTFYHEGVAAQPGPGAPNHDALNAWIFGGTALGDTLTKVADHLTDDEGPWSNLVRGFLIPEGHYRGGSAF